MTLDRRNHWQKIYSDRQSNEVSWFQSYPAISLRMIEQTKISKHSRIIDVGGGASVLVDHLLQLGFNQLSVLDIAANALDAAKQRLADQAEKVNWIEADITQFQPIEKYDLWHDRAVFHFLTQASEQKAYVNVLKQSMAKDGFVIIASFSVGGPEKCSGLPIVQYDESKIKAVLGDEFRLLEICSEVHITPSKQQQDFSYFLFQYL